MWESILPVGTADKKRIHSRMRFANKCPWTRVCSRKRWNLVGCFFLWSIFPYIKFSKLGTDTPLGKVEEFQMKHEKHVDAFKRMEGYCLSNEDFTEKIDVVVADG